MGKNERTLLHQHSLMERNSPIKPNKIVNNPVKTVEKTVIVHITADKPIEKPILDELIDKSLDILESTTETTNIPEPFGKLPPFNPHYKRSRKCKPCDDAAKAEIFAKRRKGVRIKFNKLMGRPKTNPDTQPYETDNE